jgi:hypothetical protein
MTVWLIIAGVILIVYVIYQSRRVSSDDLNVEPHAAEEIEKAKRR